jgi:dienelactone hydrolase
MRRLAALWQLMLLLAMAGEASAACEGIVAWDKIHYETVQVPRQVADSYDKGDIRLTTYIYRPISPERLPTVIFNHGSTGRGQSPAKAKLFPSCEFIRFFTESGYAIVAPNRRGRGESTGTYIEECTSCSSAQYYAAGANGLEDAIKDLEATFEFLAAQPFVDLDRLLLSGQSRGGFLSVIYAGRRPAKIKGVVNFSGGWFGDSASSPSEYGSFNTAHFHRAGSETSLPMLWLYRENDRYYAPPFIRKFHDSFRSGGGVGELRIYPNDTGRDGHNFTHQPALWLADVRSYLARLP